MSLTLARAFRMEPSSCVAFIGAGGKTTAIFKLARELQSRVIVTATTHLGAWQIQFADRYISTEADSLEESEDGFQGVLLITGKLEGDRVKPINDELLIWLHHYCKSHSIPLLIEADGSRQKPLKAWADHEPPIPEFADIVVHAAGLMGLGKPLTDEFVHRADAYSKFSRLENGEAISPNAIVRVLTHPEGGLRKIPKNARRIVMLNQADTPELQSTAHTMTQSLLSDYQSVVVASLANEKLYAVHEPIAGIILAAGKSARFGEPKQLLGWKGQPFVRAVAQTALHAGLSPVIVVTGANSEQVEAVISDLDLIIARNGNWRSGQGSSIREGILALTQPPLSLRDASPKFNGVGGVVFLLADQPQVSAAVIHALKEKHAEELHPIVAPMVSERRGNPVLFDHVTFPDLMDIKGDTGGRAVFYKHRVEYLPWHDDSLLLDVDTPEQYQRLISNGDL